MIDETLFYEDISTDNSELSFATIGSIYPEGITLIFPGENAPSQKKYKCNAWCRFSAGDRVAIKKDNGTYVVMFPIGNPAEPSVILASTANAVTNQSNSSSAIQVRSPSTGKFQLRVGSGSWYDIN